jgi:hypothetical protein
MKMATKNLGFRCHTPNLLKEIMCNNHMSILVQPMRIFQDLLAQVATRAIELDDEKLNKLMVRLTLFEQADPASPHYSKEITAWAQTPSETK